MKVKDIVLISILASIVFVLEQVLTFIPNVQFTFLLLIVYSKSLKTNHVLIIILIHVLLDNLFMGSFNLIFMPFMFIGYSIIPITFKYIKTNNEIHISFISILFCIVYCLLFSIPSCITTGIKLIDYLTADLIFMLILSISTFISVLWLYKPLSIKFKKLEQNYRGNFNEKEI